jgi:membrane fusion protein (multidrug efflux system)
MPAPQLLSGLRIGILGTALGALAACGGGPPAGFPPGGFKPQVTVVTLQPQTIELTREFAGRTSPYRVAEVRPQVNGIIRERLFTEGGFVRAGAALYQIDDSLYRAQYESAMASLKKSQATLQAAKLAADRSRALVQVDAVSAQDNENAVAAEAQAEADVGTAQAALDSSRVTLGYARIVAPISGRIGKSSVTQGALVTANQDASLATIQQLDPIYVEVNQSSNDWLSLKQEIDAGRVHSDGAGTPAKIQLENGATYGYEGKLQFADVTVDPSTGNFLLRVIVPNPKALLLPGMYVRALLSEGQLSQGLLAPQQGITRDPKGNASALVVDAHGTVQARTVQVSRAIGDQWLVESGLGAGDRLIVEGVQKTQPGMTVQPVERSAADTTAAAGAPPAASGAPGAH